MLFTKTLLSGSALTCGSVSNITLIHNLGQTSGPTNFRMIALPSSVGKISTSFLLLAFSRSFFKQTYLSVFTKSLLVKNKWLLGTLFCSQLISPACTHTEKKALHCTWFDPSPTLLYLTCFIVINSLLLLYLISTASIPSSLQLSSHLGLPLLSLCLMEYFKETLYPHLFSSSASIPFLTFLKKTLILATNSMTPLSSLSSTLMTSI